MMTDEMNQYPYQYEDGGDNGGNNTLKGYRIVIIILICVIGILAVQYYRQVNMLRGSEELLTIERDTLQSRLSALIMNMDSIKTENDTISQNLMVERNRADSLMDALTKHKRLSYAEINKYKKQVATLTKITQGYVRQIDSLDRINKQLSRENISYRKKLTAAQLRAEAAEEKSQELSHKVQQGSIIRAREITLNAMTNKDKEVDKAKRATRLRISFILNANAMASVGERNVYVRVTGPDDVVLAESPNALFEFNGEKITYTAMRSDVDYQGEDLPVALFYSGSFTAGRYIVEIYMDGHLIGSNEHILR